VDRVSGAVAETDQAAGRVERAARELAAGARSLSHDIETFLEDIARDEGRNVSAAA
jgi:hypothetical protein